MLPSTVALCSQGFAADRGAQFPLALATIARWWNCGLGDLRSPPPRGYVNRNLSKQTGGGLAPSGLFFFQLFLELSPCFDRRPIVLH